MARRSRIGANPKPASVAGVTSSDASLSRIARRVSQLAALKEALWPHLPEEIRSHCDIANYRDSTLVLTAESPVWATRLRHASSAIIHIAQANFKIPVRTIEVRVAPGAQQPDRSRQPRSVSSSASESLSQAAAACPDEQLRSAYLRLAGKSKKKP